MRIPPTEQYWSGCEKRLRDALAAQPQPPAFLTTLSNVRDFLDCITSECKGTVKEISHYELNIMALCITSKLIFDTPIIYNLDISHFLSDSYSIKSEAMT